MICLLFFILQGLQAQVVLSVVMEEIEENLSRLAGDRIEVKIDPHQHTLATVEDTNALFIGGFGDLAVGMAGTSTLLHRCSGFKKFLVEYPQTAPFVIGSPSIVWISRLTAKIILDNKYGFSYSLEGEEEGLYEERNCAIEYSDIRLENPDDRDSAYVDYRILNCNSDFLPETIEGRASYTII